MKITTVVSSKKFEKDFKNVPQYIQKKVMFWVHLIETIGLKETSICKGFHDEPLKGTRKGQRSVRMNKAYRVIYRVIHSKVEIELLEVNKHDY